jgi:hypothetical protein
VTKSTQAIAIALFLLFTVGCWTARGVLERKPPSFFESVFASLSCFALLADPTAAKKITISFLEQLSKAEDKEN